MIPKAAPRAQVQRSGELEEITGAQAEARRKADVKAALAKAKTLADFQAVAREFGNKPGWAWKMHQIYSQFRGRRAA
jgi:hypothetical protein